MDDVALRRVPEGGMEVRMVKRLAPADADRVVTPPDPRYLATAIEIVTRAGAIQRPASGPASASTRRATIDLVTEVDLEVEQHVPGAARRALPRPRHPRRGARRRGARGRSHRWVFDPLDGTTNFAHGVPIFCSSLALEIDGEAVVGAVFDPNRQELFTAERGVGAWLNGAPLRVSSTADGDRRACWSPASPTTCTRRSTT